MSGLFCSSPQLCMLERQMQQPSGYRPRRQGICIMNVEEWKSRGNYTELVDCVISSMQMEHLKNRISEIFEKVDKEMIFGSMKHRKDFYFLLTGRRGKNLCIRIMRLQFFYCLRMRNSGIRCIGRCWIQEYTLTASDSEGLRWISISFSMRRIDRPGTDTG